MHGGSYFSFTRASAQQAIVRSIEIVQVIGNLMAELVGGDENGQSVVGVGFRILDGRMGDSW